MEELDLDYVIIKLKKKSSDRQKTSSQHDLILPYINVKINPIFILQNNV